MSNILFCELLILHSTLSVIALFLLPFDRFFFKSQKKMLIILKKILLFDIIKTNLLFSVETVCLYATIGELWITKKYVLQTKEALT